MMLIRVLKEFCGTRQRLRSYQVELLSDLDALKTKIAKEYFFVRKNYQQIGEEIQALIATHRWNRLRRALNIVRIVQLDSWLTLRKVALTLQTTINSASEMKALTQAEIEDLLAVLLLLRYEPVSKNAKLSSQEYLYDDITNFTVFLKEYVEQVSKGAMNEHYLQLVRYGIHSNPELFEKKKDQIQRYIISNLQLMLGKGYYLTEFISRGLISNFWSHNFKQYLISKFQRGINAKQIAPLLFQNLKLPTIIQPSPENKRIKTELEISNILEGYQYDVQSNVLINNYEVDALLGKLVVIEYNGHYHYAVNSKKMVPTLKQTWKMKVLRNRGFVVVSIPYWQWKYLKLFEEKRDYLVKKVENQIIKHYS